MTSIRKQSTEGNDDKFSVDGEIYSEEIVITRGKNRPTKRETESTRK